MNILCDDTFKVSDMYAFHGTSLGLMYPVSHSKSWLQSSVGMLQVGWSGQGSQPCWSLRCTCGGGVKIYVFKKNISPFWILLNILKLSVINCSSKRHQSHKRLISTSTVRRSSWWNSWGHCTRWASSQWVSRTPDTQTCPYVEQNSMCIATHISIQGKTFV